MLSAIQAAVAQDSFILTSHITRLQSLARRSFCALGLRDFARVDFKEDAFGRPVFLEANSLPGMTQTSLFPLAARVGGISSELLCEKMAQKEGSS